MFLAGSDTTRFPMSIAVGGGACFLTSYYHAIRGRYNSDQLSQVTKIYHHLRGRGADWIMDSGLFTMMFGAGKGKSYTATDLLAYTDRYLVDMRSMDFRHTIVEMDVHKVLGLQHLAAFRSKFEKGWGIDRTMFVWHLEEKLAGLQTLAKRYPYIALSIPELRACSKIVGELVPCVKKLVGVALDANPQVKIHLLGCTQSKAMQLPGVWSCDSSSWLQGNSFARTYIHKDGRNRPLHRRSPQAKQLTDAVRSLILTRWKALERASGVPSKLNYQCINLALNAHAFVSLNRWIRTRYYSNAPLPTITGLTPLTETSYEKTHAAAK
tara:strand:- start:781 stop:1752 length:972 start_codon:yes stop_codon:yes gene_type:complete